MSADGDSSPPRSAFLGNSPFQLYPQATGSGTETVERVAESSSEEAESEVEPVRGPLTRSRSRVNSDNSTRSQNTRNAVKELNQQLLVTAARVAELEAARGERARAEQGTVDSGIGREAEMAMTQEQMAELLARLVIVSEQNSAAVRRLTEAMDLRNQPVAAPVVAPVIQPAPAALEGAALKIAMEALPVFRGPPQSVEQWLAQVSKTFRNSGASAALKLSVVQSKLQGPVVSWYQSLDEHVTRDWRLLEQALIERFGRHYREDEWFASVQASKQRNGESLDTYELRMQELFALRPYGTLTEEDRIRYLLLGLRDHQLAQTVAALGLDDYAVVWRKLRDLAPFQVAPAPAIRKVNFAPAVDKPTVQGTGPTPQAGGGSLRSGDRSGPATVPGPRCYNCNGGGHLARECPQPRRERSQQGNAYVASLPQEASLEDEDRS